MSHRAGITSPWVGRMGFTLLVMSLLLGAVPTQAKKIALVLGNQQYTNIGPLKNPENDARDLAHALGSLKFELVGKNSAGDGGPVLNEDLLGMTEALTRFGREAADADLALVFYAGHGATIDNESYLLPVNAISPLEGDSLSEARLQVLKRNSLPLKDVLKYMERVQGGKIAIIDACRELLSLQHRSLLESAGNEGTFRGGLVPPGGRTNQLLLAFSGASGQLVQDGTGRNSPYTKVLLEELRQPKQRDIVAFFTDVAAESSQSLSGSGNAQTPVVELRGLRSGRYFLADAAAAPGPDKPLEPDQRDLIREIQKGLTRLGYSLGEANGLMGPGTTASIKAFERSHGLSVSGAATEALLEHLVVAKGPVGVKPNEPVAGDKWTNSLGMEFVMIPEGSFRMGDDSSSQGEEKPAHNVTISKPFWLMTTEVTVGQFRRFVNANKGYQTEAEKIGGCMVRTADSWNYQSDKNWRNPGFTQRDDHPVVCVNWNDAQEMIDWLNRNTTENYRLPTEAEWEYACRGGVNGEEYCGSNLLDVVGWYRNNSGNKSHPVGQRQVNGYGLFDMSGNALEWVQDCWINNYNNGPSTETAREKNLGRDCESRVLRGGSWDFNPVGLRAATRYRYPASDLGTYSGFRLVQGR